MGFIAMEMIPVVAVIVLSTRVIPAPIALPTAAAVMNSETSVSGAPETVSATAYAVRERPALSAAVQTIVSMPRTDRTWAAAPSEFTPCLTGVFVQPTVNADREDIAVWPRKTATPRKVTGWGMPVIVRGTLIVTVTAMGPMLRNSKQILEGAGLTAPVSIVNPVTVTLIATLMWMERMQHSSNQTLGEVVSSTHALPVR